MSKFLVSLARSQLVNIGFVIVKSGSSLIVQTVWAVPTIIIFAIAVVA